MAIDCAVRSGRQSVRSSISSLDTVFAPAMRPGTPLQPPARARVSCLHANFSHLEMLKVMSLTAAWGDVVAIISGSGEPTLLRSEQTADETVKSLKENEYEHCYIHSRPASRLQS